MYSAVRILARSLLESVLVNVKLSSPARKCTFLHSIVDQFKPNFVCEASCRCLSTSHRCFAAESVPIQGSGVSNGNRRINKALQHLDSDIQKLNRIYITDLEYILQVSDAVDIAQHGVLFLQCCGDLLPDQVSSKRLQLAQKVWDSLKQLGDCLTVAHYNALLGCYAENTYPVKWRDFLQSMGTVEPNEETFHKLLRCVCECGDVDQAAEIIADMKRRDLAVSETVFNSLLLGYGRARDMDSCCGVLELMNSAQVTPTAATYAALLQGHAIAGDVDSLQKVLQTVATQHLGLTVRQLMAVARSLAVSGHEELLPELLQLLQDSSQEAVHLIRNMATQLVHLGHEQAAVSLLGVLPSEGDGGAFLVQEMVHASRPTETVLAICDKLAESGTLARAVECAAEAALMMGSVEPALSYLKAMRQRGRPLRPHYFWPLLLGASRTEGEEGALAVLDAMILLGVQPDHDTLANYLLPAMSRTEPRVVVRKLQDRGLTVSTVLPSVVVVLLRDGQLATALTLCQEFKAFLSADIILQPLASGYVRSGDANSAVKLLGLIEDGHMRVNTAQQFLLELVSQRVNPKQLIELLEACAQAGLRVSSQAVDTARNQVSQEVVPALELLMDENLISSLDDKYSQHIPHPRHMSLEALECHLVELRAKNMNTRGVLRRLLQEHSRKGNLERVLKIKQELEEVGHTFSPGMLSTLFDLHVKMEKLDEAEGYLDDLSRIAPNFIVDEYKMLDFATLLFKNGAAERAIFILQQRAEQRRPKGGPAVGRNCKELLLAVSVAQGPEKTRRVLELLCSLGYCKPTNVLLGPLVRAHLLRGNLEGAVKEFCRCATTYRFTPLVQELMGEAASQDSTKLEAILKASRAVHGASATHTMFAIALAETGLAKPLRKLLADTKAQIKHQDLLSRCQRLADQDKLSALEILTNAARGVAGLDVTPVYSLMMQAHCRRGDCRGALALWAVMQERDIAPSPELLRMLADFLQSNRQPVPFAVPS